jgi:Tfp pilus assembly protein PilF
MLPSIRIFVLGIMVLIGYGCATSPQNTQVETSSSKSAQGRLGYVKSKSQDAEFKKFEYQFSMDMTTSISMEKEDRQYFNLCKIYAGELIPEESMLASCTQAISAVGASQKSINASYYNRGLIKQKLERFEDARSDYKAAINLDANFGDGYLALAGLSMRDGDMQTARQYIESALTKKVRHPAYAHYLLGHALEAESKFVEARAEYRRALELRPNWRDAMRRIDRINISWPEAN